MFVTAAFFFFHSSLPKGVIYLGNGEKLMPCFIVVNHKVTFMVHVVNEI